MGKVTVYCVVSGCTPEVAEGLSYMDSYGPIVTSAFAALADAHELSSQDDLCVIGPIHPSGGPYGGPWRGEPDVHVCDLQPETDIRILPHCVMGDSWDFGFVDAPPPNKHDWSYLVSYGCNLMIQTYALDIMALATQGRMTPLRLWRLAMEQGFEDAGRPSELSGVGYGEITGLQEQFPDLFPAFSTKQITDLENLGDVEMVKQRLVNEGLFWVWMTADLFPITPTNLENAVSVLPEVLPYANHSTMERLPSDVLISIVSFLPLASVFNLATASRLLRTAIFGNDYLASRWIYDNAPWWIPVRTQTPRKDEQKGTSTTDPLAYLASQWSAQTELTPSFPTGPSWAYIMRCMRSGSMRNRRRIWNTALDIEYAADLAGV